MNERPIEIKIQYNSNDYWRSSFDYYFDYNFFTIYFWTFVFFGMFILFLFAKGDVLIFSFLKILAAAFLFYCLFSLAMSYLSVTNAKKLDEGEYLFSFSPENVTFKAVSFTTKLDWTYVTRIKETGNHFVIYLKSGQRTIVPKRYFDDYDQLAEFKKLVLTKLKERVYLKKSKETMNLK